MAYHAFSYRPKKRHKYSALFNNNEDKAKLAYNKDVEFRRFVQTFDPENPELLGWSLVDFHRQYLKNGYQLTLAI